MKAVECEAKMMNRSCESLLKRCSRETSLAGKELGTRQDNVPQRVCHTLDEQLAMGSIDDTFSSLPIQLGFGGIFWSSQPSGVLRIGSTASL